MQQLPRKAADPLTIAAALADSAGLPSSTSRDLVCLHVARFLREDSVQPSARSGNHLRIYKIADALGLGSIEPLRWSGALFLIAIGGEEPEKGSAPPSFVGWTRADLERFVFKGIIPPRAVPPRTKVRSIKRARRRARVS